MHSYIWHYTISHHEISRQLSYWSYLGLQTEGHEKLVVYPVSHVDQVIAGWSHKIRRNETVQNHIYKMSGRKI